VLKQEININSHIEKSKNKERKRERECAKNTSDVNKLNTNFDNDNRYLA